MIIGSLDPILGGRSQGEQHVFQQQRRRLTESDELFSLQLHLAGAACDDVAGRRHWVKKGAIGKLTHDGAGQEEDGGREREKERQSGSGSGSEKKVLQFTV